MEGNKVKKVISSVATVVVVVAVVVGLKFYNKHKTSGEVLAQAESVVQTVPGYEQDPAYHDALFEKAHDEAFSEAYSMGGRRTRARFDSERYLEVLLSTMRDMARADGRQEVAASIESRRVLLELPVEE